MKTEKRECADNYKEGNKYEMKREKRNLEDATITTGKGGAKQSYWQKRDVGERVSETK